MMLVLSINPDNEADFIEALNTLTIKHDPRSWFEELSQYIDDGYLKTY